MEVVIDTDERLIIDAFALGTIIWILFLCCFEHVEFAMEKDAGGEYKLCWIGLILFKSLESITAGTYHGNAIIFYAAILASRDIGYLHVLRPSVAFHT